MPKDNETTKEAWFGKNFFAVVAVGVAIANLWLFSKLAPIALDINTIQGQVLANEFSISNINENLTYIRGRVDKLYNLWIKE